MSREDNQFYSEGCPAMMNDGRFLTSYASSQVVTDSLRLANGLDPCRYDNNDFRLFLQRNANKILNKERQYLFKNYFCWLPKRPTEIELPFCNKPLK